MIIRSVLTGLTWQCLSILRNNSNQEKYSLKTAECSLLAFGIIAAIWSRPAQKLFKVVRKMILELSLSSIHSSQFSLELHRGLDASWAVISKERGAKKLKKRIERELRASRRTCDLHCEIAELKSRLAMRRFNSLFSSNPLQNLFWPLFCLRNFSVQKKVPFPKVDRSVTIQALHDEIGRGDFELRDLPNSENQEGRSGEQLGENDSFVGEEILDRLQPIVLKQQAKVREIYFCLSDREDLERKLMPENFDQDEPSFEEIPANTS